MYVIKKMRPDGTVQYVASFKTSNNGTDIKYHSNPRYAMVFSDMPSAKALIQLAGIAFAASVDIVDHESCFNTVSQGATFAGYHYDELDLGKGIYLDQLWTVVKRSRKDAKVYLMTQSCIGETQYSKPTYNAKTHCVDNTGTDFKRSNLYTLCKYMDKSLENIRDYNKLVTTQSGFKVGVMTKEMLEDVNGLWREASSSYWTSSEYANGIWYVNSSGRLDSVNTDEIYGFRPYICVNMGGE